MLSWDSMTVKGGDKVSAVLLENGEFVACVYRGLVEDYARQSVRTMALKVFKSARKKFSKLIFNVCGRDVSAWDYFCYGIYKGNSVFGDKFVSDFLRLGVLRRIEALSEEKRRLIEISACDFRAIDEYTVLDGNRVFAMVHVELQSLLLAHGRSFSELSGATPHHAIENGASPT
jgi:hypothetical protein